MKITIDVSEKNEGTNSPWWIIIDTANQKQITDYNDIIPMITGPFFSREEAENYIREYPYRFTKHAVVFCKSGYPNDKYSYAYNIAKSELGST